MSVTPSVWKDWTQVNTTETGPRDSAELSGRIAALPDGGYIVVWIDLTGTYSPQGNAILARRYDFLGNPISDEIKISPFLSGSQNSPAVTELSDGRIAIGFTDRFDGTDQILVQIYDSALNLVRTDTIETGTDTLDQLSLSALLVVAMPSYEGRGRGRGL